MSVDVLWLKVSLFAAATDLKPILALVQGNSLFSSRSTDSPTLGQKTGFDLR